MKIIIRFCLTFTFLCAIFISKGKAQSLVLADSLFKEQKFFEAAIEYDRIAFYSNDRSIIVDTKYKTALCYRFLNEYDKAISELQKINILGLDADIRLKLIYECVINSFLNKNYAEVELYVNKLKFYEKNEDNYLSVMPTYILSLNAIRNWDKAKEVFTNYIYSLSIDNNLKLEYISSLNSLYSRKSVPKEYSEETAVNLSRFIPGAGQFYTGHILEGAFAFSLCSACVFSAGYAFYYKYYFTGYILGFGLLYESYTGGMKRVAHLAHRKNEDSMNLFNRKCVELLIKINS